MFSALSGSQLTNNSAPNLQDVVLRLPKIILWNWLNVSIFDLSNQRLDESILEDRVNKPWRPIPSRRITASNTRRLLLWTIPVVVLLTSYLGGMAECVAMLGLTWMYNDLGGADGHYMTRNAINAFGFACYSSGSTRVAAGHGLWDLNQRANTRLGLIWAIVFATMQVQDMADVKGDAARGRRTLPLVHGQFIARLSIAVPVLAFSFICPWYWGLGVSGYVLPLGMGSCIAIRAISFYESAADLRTFKLWCVWTGILYLLPLLKDHSVFQRALSI